MTEHGYRRNTARALGKPEATRWQSFAMAIVCASLLGAGLLGAGCKESKAEPKAEPAPNLVGSHGSARFNLKDHQGKVVVLTFGYTYCPDVCPMTLATLRQAYSALGEKKKDVSIVFVSVDPKRDSAETVAKYAAGFDSAFFGVSPADLDETIGAYDLKVSQRFPDNTAAAKVADTDRDGFYFVDHTGLFFLIDRAGLIQKKLPVQATHRELATEIERLVEKGAS
jgi:protein SCO1/2